MRKSRKGIAVITAAAIGITSFSVSTPIAVFAAEDVVVKLNPADFSTFNDTNGDGFGEFEGWGTSLCWWANRVGYSEKLTKDSGELFFGDTGLDMNIGRYNIGGGDLVGEVPKVTVNVNAQFYDLETAGRTPKYAGSSMKVNESSSMANVTYTRSDADFGINSGTKVGNFKVIGWINKLDEAVGSGDNLHYTVNVEESGNYTIKLLMTLAGTSTRDAALRVNGTKDYIVYSDEINSNIIASGNNNALYMVTFSGVALNAGNNTINIAGKSDWTLDFVKMAVIKAGKEGVLPEGSEFVHSPHITRSDSAVPGYATDVTKINLSKHDITWYQENFARADKECGYAWNYDWDADNNQVNVLKAAAKASGNEFHAEAFLNSPPYFMTNSGCTSGAVDANKDNLRADSYNAFAAYIADVIEYWHKEGIIIFQSTSPMNEPYTNYWSANSNKQEGCHFDQGTSQSRILVALDKELEKKGIDIIICGTDETSVDTAITSYNALSNEAKDAIDRIDAHTYGGSQRTQLKRLAENEGKNLWMSEVDGSYTAGTNAGEMSAALGFAKQVILDLNALKSSAWILWNAIDMHVDNEMSAVSSQDYSSLSNLYRRVNMNGGYWGIAIADHDNEEIVLTKKYYSFGQFSRYIRPGYTIIGSSDNTLAAYDTKGKKVVIVAVNTSGADQTWKFDLSNFNTMSDKITAIRTSGSLASGENWADVSENCNIVADTQNRNVTATMKANSITTYIIEGVDHDNTVEKIVSFEDSTVYSVPGIVPTLPEKVIAKTNWNRMLEVDVSWDLEGVDLTKNTTVTGIVEGSTDKATLQIVYVSPNVQYFIDCNNPLSTRYQETKSYADLYNDVPDQAYANGSWGYLDTYGAYNGNGDDSYQAGWYAYSNQAISYTIPLKAGIYNLQVGFREWWNVSRPMKVTMSVKGEVTQLGTTNSMASNGATRNTENYHITVQQDAGVTFSVLSNGSADPVLSFIQIQRVLELDELITIISEAENVDRSKYTIEMLDTLDRTVEEGKVLPLKAASTQEQIDASVKAIREAMDCLEEKKLPYTDVEEGSWYYGAVEEMYDSKIMTGTTKTTFEPFMSLTRAQFATIVYRLGGSESVDIKDIFNDVDAADWFATAVTWANSNAIITGYGDGSFFGPHDNITREQLVVILYRYALFKGYNVDAREDLDEYPDADKISEYADTAVRWAVAEGLLTGDQGKINPQGSANRAMGAVIIARFIENCKI